MSGWMTGFEPATNGSTVHGSTVELHPPYRVAIIVTGCPLSRANFKGNMSGEMNNGCRRIERPEEKKIDNNYTSGIND